MDVADMAHLEAEVWLQSALAAARQRRVQAIQHSTRCYDCGASIPQRRRRCLPHTKLCVGCAEAHERRERLGLNGPDPVDAESRD